MKLVGNLHKQVEGTKNKEEAKEVIENAGMLLTDDELDDVTGGFYNTPFSKGTCHECNKPLVNGVCQNPNCSQCVNVFPSR